MASTPLPKGPPVTLVHNQSDEAQAGGSGSGQTENKFKQITEGKVIERVRKEIATLTGFTEEGFPGCQPVLIDQKNMKLLRDGYRVSLVVDGTIRYLMYIAGEKEIYFMDINNNIFQMDGLSFPSAQDPSNHLFKTLVDGEIVASKADGKQCFLIFDIISVDGVKVGEKFFQNRYSAIQTQIINPRSEAVKSGSIFESEEPIEIRRKMFFPVNTCSITELLSKELKNACPHKLDGLIFKPINDPYKPGKCFEMLKWESSPSHKSIDFLLKITMEQRYGMSEIKVGKLFVGGQKHAFGQMLHTKDMDHLDGSIVECTLDVKTGRWVLLRQRTEKKTPNYKTTAIAVLRSIKYPESCFKNLFRHYMPKTGLNDVPFQPVTVPNLKSLCARVVRAQNLPTTELPVTLVAFVEMRQLSG